MPPFRAGFLAAAAVTVYGAVTERDKLQWLAKPLLMPLLAADVAAHRGALDPTDRTLLLASLGAATSAMCCSSSRTPIAA